MKTGSLHKIKVTKLTLALISLFCVTIILWAWDRTRVTSSYPPVVEHLELLVPESVIVTGNSDHGGQKQYAGEDLTERTQNFSREEKKFTIPQVDSIISSSEQNTGDTNAVHKNPSADEDMSGAERMPHEDISYPLPQANSLSNSSLEQNTGNVVSQKVPRVNKECNYAKGKWVEDEKRPLYSGLGCKQWLSVMWACRLMKRIDFSYERYRWQPQGCNMPEFSGHEFLRRMQHKTIALVGDSLGRQQFQSLMCMVTAGKPYHEVEDVGKEYKLVKPRGVIRPDGWAYRFKRTNTTILYYWSASLCELEPLNKSDPATSYAMHLDRPATFLRQYLHRFDVLVLNTGHHWNRYKFKSNRWEMYVNGVPNTDRKTAAIGNAKNLTIFSIVKWLDSQLQYHPRLKAFFRTISPRHFVNGDWNTGGSCDSSVPLSSGSEVVLDSSKDFVAESAVRGTRVKLLDITALSELRDESHISKYSAKSANGAYDCLHWCLPGIPDTWNELLYAQIL